MASLEGCGGTAPDDTLQGGDTRRENILWANLQRTVEKRGRTGKKSCVVTTSRGDTRAKATKSDSDSDSDEQKSRQFFQEKIEG